MSDRRTHAQPVDDEGIAVPFAAPGPQGEAKKTPNYTAFFAQELLELGAVDRRIVGITAGMPTGTGLAGFQAAYPDRFIDVGIAEQHAVTFAAGLATQGCVPIVAVYSSFLQRAFDQIVHQINHADHGQHRHLGLMRIVNCTGDVTVRRDFLEAEDMVECVKD